MATTLCASTTVGVYRISDHEMAKQSGKYIYPRDFYASLKDLRDGEHIYSCFDLYSNLEHVNLFETIDSEYGIR